MKNKAYRGIIALCSALIVLGFSSSAEASCVWVPNHWVNGQRVPGHQVCNGANYRYGYRYGYTTCRWIPAGWQNGYWHEGHRACWRR